MNKKKLFCIINVFVIFGCSFITHNLYEWFPSFLTSIFPVNESLFEHMKMIFITPVIFSSILYFIFRKKGIRIDNFLPGLFCSVIACIILFYLIYLPLYYKFGEIMIITLIVYFISIFLSQVINYWFITFKNSTFNNIVSFIIIIICCSVLVFFTYHPLKYDFFRDPLSGEYGINK